MVPPVGGVKVKARFVPVVVVFVPPPVKLAVHALALSMVITRGLVVPEHSPPQPANVALVSAVAVSKTTLPLG
jgi:hypothetical protein